MTSTSSPDTGGHDRRPPDPSGARSVATALGLSPDEEVAQRPPNQTADSSGPHKTGSNQQEQPARRLALVTTPSDAQGGRRTTLLAGEAGYRETERTASAVHEPARTALASYATAVRRGPANTAAEATSTPTAVAGTWSPRQRHILLQTLASDWTQSTAPVDTEEQAHMRAVAMAESKVHLNSALRERTALETETMLAYMNQTLELPYPPNFVKATMPVLQRAMVEQYHETHLEATLTADVDPRARLRKSMTHNTLIGMMYSANGDTARGRLMISRLMEDVKRLKFDGIHTLSFVFNSQRIAQLYQGFAFRLNGTCIELEDTTAGHDKGTYRQARLRRQYALRAYGVEDLGLVAFLAALSKLPGVRIVDAERPRLEATDIVDNSYFLLRFQEEQCPAALQGVTKVFINGKLVTFHHHVVHQRMPCARCYAPFHTTGFCKANPTQLKRNQAKFQRTYSGPVPAFDVGEAIQYHHTDGDSLSNFLETLTRELTAVMNTVAETESAPEGASLVTTGPIPGHAGQPTVAAGRTGNAQGPVPARVTPSETTPATDADGFRTVVRRPAHTRHIDLDNKPELRQQTSEETSDVGLAELPACNRTTSHARGDHPDASVRANQDTYPSVGTRQRGQKSKAKAKQQAKPPAFAKFKKAMAMGKFALLHDGDSDDNADASDDELDEAPYAYEPAPLTPTEVVHDGLGQYGALAEEDSEDEVAGSDKDAMSDIVSDDDSQKHMDVQSAEGCHDDSVSRRDTTATYSPFTPKDETSERVTGQPNATSGQVGKETSAMVQTTLTSFVTSAGEVIETSRTAASPVAHEEDDFVPGSPDSQQEFTMGTTHRATPDGDHTEPIRVAQFLDSFDGYEVAVPANGQCAMLALYATISNNSTRTLKNTATTVKQAGVIKRGIYALMLANLRRDVEVGLLDPVTVYHDLYPDHPLFDSKEAATAALYAHYEQERDRPTNATVPSSFWAGPHELRAIAQYLREPLLVLDVDRTGIATMQRYTYKVHRLQNGEDHESGCYEAFSHSQARDYMYACWSLHVLPYFMVRHVSERHFYGVAHGDTFVKWRAEGDNDYAANVSSSYSWKGTVNYLRPEEDSDLESLNKLANLDNVNSVIIKRLPMRERLDIVCARLGLPTLDAVGYDDEEDLERTIAAEGRLLQEALGIDGYASGSQASQDGTGMDIVLPVRYPRASSGEVVENAYFRLLRAPEGEEIDKEDYGQYKLFTAANAEAFSKWCSLYRSRLEIPATRRRSNPRTIAPWLLEHVGVLRHLFAFLPYPELEAKQWASENLYQWGAVEAFREQSDAIWRIKNDTAVALDARELCTSWHSAISKGPDSTRYTLAGDSHRWARLRRMIGTERCREDTTGLDGEGWALLHILPYVTSTWSTTPMGKAPSGARGVWYHEFPSVRELCHGILEREDWSAALQCPAGQTWSDQHASEVAGTTIPPRH